MRERDVSARNGDWMQTYTGRAFWPLDPRVEDIDLLDIAQALSNLCRYAGHTRRFYSVAEHSYLLAGWCARNFPDDKELLRYVLLHDAAEAYLVDIPRPLKRSLPGYSDIEARVESVIWERFGIVPDAESKAVVKEIDDRIIEDERLALLAGPPEGHSWRLRMALGVAVVGEAPEQARAHFLTCANLLGIR